MGEHVLIPEDVEPARRIDLGDGVALLVYDPPAGGPHNVRVLHRCRSWPDEQEPDGELVTITAPALHPDHQVHSLDPPTITASVLCPACGLHGFVTDGTWRPC
jgi:hypothetical protein